jgi:hypothetical protein
VQHDGHAIDFLAQLGAYLGIGGFVQMHDRNSGSGKQGTQTPTHVRPTNDDDVARFHEAGSDATRMSDLRQ